MKTPILILLTLFLGYVGCCTTNDNSLRNLEARFRQRLMELDQFRQASAQIRELRFSSDCKSVLVIVDLPPDSKQTKEFVLNDDGFRRYTGQWRRTSAGGAMIVGQTFIAVDVATK